MSLFGLPQGKSPGPHDIRAEHFDTLREIPEGDVGETSENVRGPCLAISCFQLQLQIWVV